jgi:hypothetical protein
MIVESSIPQLDVVAAAVKFQGKFHLESKTETIFVPAPSREGEAPDPEPDQLRGTIMNLVA